MGCSRRYQSASLGAIVHSRAFLACLVASATLWEGVARHRAPLGGEDVQDGQGTIIALRMKEMQIPYTLRETASKCRWMKMLESWRYSSLILKSEMYNSGPLNEGRALQKKSLDKMSYR